jgi:IS5 family transposase
MRAFAGIDLGQEPPPDASTVCKFRHLLERNGLGTKLFQEVGRYLQSRPTSRLSILRLRTSHAGQPSGALTSI